MRAGSTNGVALAFGALVYANIAWGFSFSIGKKALEDFPPITYGTIVTCLALSLLLPPALRSGLIPVLRRNWRFLLFNGLLLAVSQATFTISLKLSPAAIIAVLTSLGPLTIIILSMAFLNERIAQRGWLGIFIATLGALLVLGVGPDELGADSSKAIIGGLIFLVTMLTWSAFNVVSKVLVTGGITPVVMTTGTMLFQALGLLVLVPIELATGPSVTWSAWTTFGILYMGVLGTALAFIAVSWALGRLEGSKVGAVYYLEQVIGVAGAWLILGEEPGPSFLIGGLLVLGGVYLVTRAQMPSLERPVVIVQGDL